MTLAEDLFALSQATQDERNVMNRDDVDFQLIMTRCRDCVKYGAIGMYVDNIISNANIARLTQHGFQVKPKPNRRGYMICWRCEKKFFWSHLKFWLKKRMTLAEEMYQLTQEGIKQMEIEQAKKDDEFWNTLNEEIRAAAIKGRCSIRCIDLNFAIRNRLAQHGFCVKAFGQQSYEICWNPQA